MTIDPCFFFAHEAEEAATFYVAIFPDSHIDHVARAAADTPYLAKGAALSVSFTLEGRRFAAINGGASFPFTEALSLQAHCADQAEVDRVWDALLAGGGTPSRCGWLKDRYGVSWQVIPSALGDYLGGPDPAGSERAMHAMLAMAKLDIDAIQRAYEGG